VSVAYSHDGTLLAAGTATGQVTVWSMETMAVVRVLQHGTANAPVSRRIGTRNRVVVGAPLSRRWPPAAGA
jgi:hypothetical protein